MKILAIDSAHEACSAAIYADGKVLASEYRGMERGQAEALMPMVQRIMGKADIRYDELSCVAVSVGPGSFTGVRVGLAAADGIALAADLPMVGVSVMEAVAFDVSEKYPETKDICIVLETKRDDYYVQRFSGMVPVSEPMTADRELLKQMASVVFTGNGVSRLIEEIGELPFLDVPMPSAETIVRLAALKTPEKKYPSPLYLREAEATLCRK